MTLKFRIVALLVFALSACGGGGGGGGNVPNTSVLPPPPPPVANADITMLFMGNSHTSVNDLPQMVAAMVRVGKPGKTVNAVVAPGWMFLEERVHDAPSLNLLRSRNWTFVVLQAQKYSSSGAFLYSTTEAEELVRLSRVQRATPIMFPEWPRRNVDETQRIFDLHLSIVRKEPACLPPIPQAWDIATARHPSLVLHDSDGNHSAPAGAFLAALVIYSTMTGLSPAALPDIPDFGLGSNVQLQLRTAATEAVRLMPPREFCPADPFP
jgi:hypothetical protein